MGFLFASLLKRSNGVWYIVYTLDGRRRWLSTRTKLKTEALRRLKNFQLPSSSKSKTPKALALSAYADEFFRYAKVNYAPATVAIFRLGLRHLTDVVGDTTLSALNARHIDAFKTTHLQRISAVRVNMELRCLRTMLNYAVRWKLLEVNPFARVPLVRVPEIPPVHFTREEFRKLMKVIDAQWLRDIVMFTLLTGLRRGEVVNLRWNDLDLERRLVHVHSTPAFKLKCGKQRAIPLNDWIVQTFGARQRPEVDDYLFTFMGKQVDKEYITHRFGDYVRVAGLRRSLHFHSLRHTFATWLVQDGVSIYEIQKLLGHSSIEMTQIYSHLQSEQLHETVNKLTPPSIELGNET